VRDGFGQGRMMHAQQAAEMGLVDRVATLGKVLGELGAGSSANVTQAQSREIEQDLCQAWDGEEDANLPKLPHVSIEAARLALQISLDKPISVPQ